MPALFLRLMKIKVTKKKTVTGSSNMIKRLHSNILQSSNIIGLLYAGQRKDFFVLTTKIAIRQVINQLQT